MIEMVNVFLHAGKAYLPVLGKTDVWLFYDTDELLVSELTVDGLTAALKEVIKRGNPAIRHPTQEEFRKSLPINRELGMRSYRKMAKAGVMACVLSWPPDRDYIGLAFSPADTDDVQKIDYKSQERYPPGTDLETIARRILDEWESRQSE